MIIRLGLLDDRHMCANIAERVLNILDEWALIHRVVSITLNNASNNSTAIVVIRDKLVGAHKELLHQRCACHIINLMVHDGLSVFVPSITKMPQDPTRGATYPLRATTYPMTSPVSSPNNELQCYMNNQCTEDNGADINVLNWWRENEKAFSDP